MHRNELPKEGQHPLVKANHMSVNGENMVMQRCPTVDGKKKRLVVYPHGSQGFVHFRWCRISAINSMLSFCVFKWNCLKVMGTPRKHFSIKSMGFLPTFLREK